MTNKKEEKINPSNLYTDTDRLNYILTFIRIEDVGDGQPGCVLGAVVRSEALEQSLGLCGDWADDLRDVIDRAIESGALAKPVIAPA